MNRRKKLVVLNIIWNLVGQTSLFVVELKQVWYSTYRNMTFVFITNTLDFKKNPRKTEQLYSRGRPLTTFSDISGNSKWN